MRGLPARLQAVPASFRRLIGTGAGAPGTDRGSGRQATGARQGETLMDLVVGLPPDLLQQALTHSSWVGERTGSYERLEFLGDSVLGLAIASALYSRFPEREEGGLARLKAFVVSRASCVQVAERMGLVSLVLEHAPASERKRREAVRSASLLGDVLEALIGAVYLEYGFERTRPAVIGVFEEQILYAATVHVDHKTALQELLAPRGMQPQYRLVDEAGPAHARIFTSEVVIGGLVRGHGSGTTIKMSEQAAAQEALAAVRGEEYRRSHAAAPSALAEPAPGAFTAAGVAENPQGSGPAANRERAGVSEATSDADSPRADDDVTGRPA
jgi:ribonuclease III